MSEEVAIQVKNLSKDFLLPHQQKNSIKSFFVNPFRKMDKERQVAFKDLNFEVKKGEFFGIVGRNGSGKSTLLKCMAGVYNPNKGSIKINGSLVPFIELGVGFNPELSGRDNVYLNGALLGFSRSEINEMYDEIVEFAELEKFMDQTLKNYSSGMQVRLAFSIAIRAKSDILLLDEVLAVGDSAFQQKCYDYFSSLKEENRTIVLVSHNMQAIEQFCDKAMLVEEGEIKKIGDSTEVGELYETMFLREEASKQLGKREQGADLIELKGVDVIQEGRTRKEIKALKEFLIDVQIESKVDIEKANIGINIKDHDKNVIIATDTLELHGDIGLHKKTPRSIVFSIPNNLTNGLYTVNVGVVDRSTHKNGSKVIYRHEGATSFIIKGAPTKHKSLTHPRVRVDLK